MRKVYRSFSQAITLKGALKKDGRHLVQEDLGIIENATIIIENGKISFIGSDSAYVSQPTDKVTFCDGKIVLPEFVDSHTHLLYAGNRSNEYLMRLNGAQYEEIAKAGGGILSSQKAFAKASDSELLDLCIERLNRISSYGVGTVEIKTGYGLEFDQEFRAMKIIDQLSKNHSLVKVIRTYMAAHAVPKTYSSSSEFMDKVVLLLLDEVHRLKLADFVDIFHESGYFTEHDVERLFSKAQSLGISRRIHADEFNDNRGAIIAHNYSCHSADHLLCTSDESINTLAKSKTVATLLPGTGFFLGKKQSRAREMLNAGVKVAIASDYNPGSCHFDNLFQIACFSAPTLKFNPCELICAITLNSSHSLGLVNQGAIEVGLDARLAVFSCKTLSDLIYDWGKNHFDYYIRG